MYRMYIEKMHTCILLKMYKINVGQMKKNRYDVMDVMDNVSFIMDREGWINVKNECFECTER